MLWIIVYVTHILFIDPILKTERIMRNRKELFHFNADYNIQYFIIIDVYMDVK